MRGIVSKESISELGGILKSSSEDRLKVIEELFALSLRFIMSLLEPHSNKRIFLKTELRQIFTELEIEGILGVKRYKD